MKNNNKLTLKQLKQELDTLKSIKQNKGHANNELKTSIINKLFKQSSMLHLWLITGILGYARKLPFLSKIISWLSLWYGRTTIWKILGKTRKLFVIFNALIGVYAMFKAVGFNFDNMLIGFMAMGHAYFEVLGNLTNKLFNWFLNLFDQRIVPNIPNNKPNNPSKSVIDYITSPIEKIKSPVSKDAWNPVLNGELPKISLRDLYMKGSPTIDISPWYRDTGTWLYIVGIGCSLGLFYLSYKIYSDPSWIFSIFSTPDVVSPTTPKAGPSNLPLDFTSRPISPDITMSNNISKGIGSILTGVTKPISYIKQKLNPFSYVSTSTEINNQYQTFMDLQNNPVSADRRYYPFTEVNPFLPWYKKLKVAVFGEGTFDSLQRLKDKTYADRIYESITISKGKYKMVEGLTPSTTPIPGTSTPGWASVGVGIKPTFVNYIDALHDFNVENKLKSITPIPKVIPTTLPDTVIADVGEWKNYNVESKTIVEASDFVEKWKANQVAGTSQVTLPVEEGFTTVKSYKTSKLSNIPKDNFPIHENKFSILN
jgi:hypothetical protein